MISPGPLNDSGERQLRIGGEGSAVVVGYVKETYDAKMCRLYLDYVEERVEEFAAYADCFQKAGLI